MRARADEMAALLDQAAPRAKRQRRRRSTALPAAVAAFGALSVGGVGLALGLTPTGAEGQLPAAPWPVLADPGTGSPTATTGAAAPETADLDPAVAGADLIRPDDRSPAGGPGRAAPSSGPRSSTTTPGPTSTTTSTPRPTRSTTPRPTKPPRPSGTRSGTPRSTTSTTPSTTPSTASTASPRPVAQRSALTAPTTRGVATGVPSPSAGPDLDREQDGSPAPEE